MTTIFYKKLLNKYEITKIEVGSGEGVCIRLDEPTDAKITLCKASFDLVRGICTIPDCVLVDGEAEPILYTSHGREFLEGFILKRGAVIQKNPDSEKVRHLTAVADNLSKRVGDLEALVEQIQNKIERKISF